MKKLMLMSILFILVLNTRSHIARAERLNEATDETNEYTSTSADYLNQIQCEIVAKLQGGSKDELNQSSKQRTSLAEPSLSNQDNSGLQIEITRTTRSLRPQILELRTLGGEEAQLFAIHNGLQIQVKAVPMETRPGNLIPVRLDVLVTGLDLNNSKKGESNIDADYLATTLSYPCHDQVTLLDVHRNDEEFSIRCSLKSDHKK